MVMGVPQTRIVANERKGPLRWMQTRCKRMAASGSASWNALPGRPTPRGIAKLSLQSGLPAKLPAASDLSVSYENRHTLGRRRDEDRIGELQGFARSLRQPATRIAFSGGADHPRPAGHGERGHR